MIIAKAKEFVEMQIAGLQGPVWLGHSDGTRTDLLAVLNSLYRHICAIATLAIDCADRIESLEKHLGLEWIEKDTHDPE